MFARVAAPGFAASRAAFQRAAEVVAGLALLCGCSALPSTSADSGSSPSNVESTPSTSASAAAAAGVTLEDRMAAEIGIIGADYPIAAFGSLWVVAADRPEPAVTRVDPHTNEVVAEILVPGRRCNGLAAGFGSVWACATDGIARIDPRSNEVISVVDVPAIGQTRLVATKDSIWAFASRNGVEPPDSLLRIDPRSEKATAIPLGHTAGTMTAAFGSIWVTSVADGLLLRVDPSTAKVQTVLDSLPQPFFVSAGLGSLWISLYGTEEAPPPADASTVLRVNPETYAVEAELSAGPIGTSGEVLADPSGVWVRSATTFLTRYDPATLAPVEVIQATEGGGSVMAAFGSIWASSYDFGHVWRIEP